MTLRIAWYPQFTPDGIPVFEKGLINPEINPEVQSRVRSNPGGVLPISKALSKNRTNKEQTATILHLHCPKKPKTVNNTPVSDTVEEIHRQTVERIGGRLASRKA